MGNVNEILRRKSLLKDGVSETVYYGEPIEHPDMWKIEINCSSDATKRHLILHPRTIYSKIILDDKLVLNEGEITNLGNNKIWFTQSGSSEIVNNNDPIIETFNGIRRLIWFAEPGDHTMYYKLSNRSGAWLYDGVVKIKGMRSPCEQNMNAEMDINKDCPFGGVVQSVTNKGTVDILTSTPMKIKNDNDNGYITRLFSKARVPIGAKEIYESDSRYAGLEIEEFKFTPIPDN